MTERLSGPVETDDTDTVATVDTTSDSEALFDDDDGPHASMCRPPGIRH